MTHAVCASFKSMIYMIPENIFHCQEHMENKKATIFIHFIYLHSSFAFQYSFSHFLMQIILITTFLDFLLHE